jgi:hypothetical protein
MCQSIHSRTTKLKIWEAQGLKGFPIELEIETAREISTIFYKNVGFVTPDPSLFTPPGGCRQMPSHKSLP